MAKRVRGCLADVVTGTNTTLETKSLVLIVIYNFVKNLWPRELTTVTNRSLNFKKLLQGDRESKI